MIDLVNILEDNNTVIKAVRLDKRCPVRELLDDLEQKDANKVYALFKLFCQKNGKITNKEKVRKLKNFTCAGCWEFKPTKQLRISFIYLKQESHHIIICLLDGFIKKQNKWPKQEIQKTEKLCEQVKKYEKTRGG